jgi:hypothetical protein
LNITGKYIRSRGLKISLQFKKECFEAINIHYKEASRKKNSIILDEFCATCGYHRRHAIKAFREALNVSPGQRIRKEEQLQ